MRHFGRQPPQHLFQRCVAALYHENQLQRPPHTVLDNLLHPASNPTVPHPHPHPNSPQAAVILLSMLGVNVSALLLPAGIAAAVAAKDLSHNFLAGAFLMIVQPFRCGA